MFAAHLEDALPGTVTFLMPGTVTGFPGKTRQHLGRAAFAKDTEHISTCHCQQEQHAGGKDAAELPVKAKAALFEPGGALQAATVPASSIARLPSGLYILLFSSPHKVLEGRRCASGGCIPWQRSGGAGSSFTYPKPVACHQLPSLKFGDAGFSPVHCNSSQGLAYPGPYAITSGSVCSTLECSGSKPA